MSDADQFAQAPSGTVWVGGHVDGDVTSHRISVPGDPEDVCAGAAQRALQLLEERLSA